MNSCSPDFLCIAYTLVCESQFVGDFIRMRVTYTAKWGLQIVKMIFQTRSSNLKAPKSIIFFPPCILILHMDCTGKMFPEIFFYDSRGVYQIRLNIL